MAVFINQGSMTRLNTDPVTHPADKQKCNVIVEIDKKVACIFIGAIWREDFHDWNTPLGEGTWVTPAGANLDFLGGVGYYWESTLEEPAIRLVQSSHPGLEVVDDI